MTCACPDLEFAALPDVRFSEVRPNDDCGCPEEEWLLFGVTTTIHFEPDSRTHVIFGAGDWDHDMMLPPEADYAAARRAAYDYVASLPIEEEIAPRCRPAGERAQFQRYDGKASGMTLGPKCQQFGCWNRTHHALGVCSNCRRPQRTVYSVAEALTLRALAKEPSA